MSDAALITYDDLESRWKPPGANPKARRKWIIRRCKQWRLIPLPGGRGDSTRFRLVDLLRIEERAAARNGALR